MDKPSAAQAAYLAARKRHRHFVTAARILLLVLFLFVWEAAAASDLIDAFIFSCPSRMWDTLKNLAASGDLALHVGTSVWETVVGFLLGTNIGEVLTVFFAMILWRQSPFLSMQLLWINLVTDSLPAIALGMEAVEDGIMDKRPKPKNEGIFAHGLGVRVVLQGVMFAVLSLTSFWIGWISSRRFFISVPSCPKRLS